MKNGIRALRKKAGITQTELAKRSGVPRVSIQRYESGTTTPSVERAVKIASALSTTVDQIAGNAERGDENAPEAV